MYDVRKSKSWFRLCVSIFNFQMWVCSSINMSVLLAKSPFNISHSRSQIEWSPLLKCLATGSPLLLTLYIFYWIKVSLKLLFAVSFSDLYIYIFSCFSAESMERYNKRCTRDANIVTLYRNKWDKGDNNDYSDVSLLSSIGKVFVKYH